MNTFALKPTEEAPAHRAGVLLPLRLAGAYDYATDEKLPRGTIVVAPLGPREYLACVWSDGDGTVAAEKLKPVEQLEGNPRLPRALCDFIDWVARYTLTPPGQVLALALRVPSAFDEEICGVPSCAATRRRRR